MGRLSRPLNSDAIKAADDEFYAKHPEFVKDGKRIPLSDTDPSQAALRKEWVELYKKHGGKEEGDEKPPAKKPDNPAEPCPNCTPSSVDLEVEKNQLTLKHDRECKLEIKVAPDNVAVSAYRIEIRRESEANQWCVLSNQQLEDPWKAKIAGKFKLRGVVTICGKEHMTAEKDVEVQFPDYAQIVADAKVAAETSTEWQNTLNDCTEDPNQRRERGFWIQLNTKSDEYEFTATVMGSWSGPTAGASVPLPSRPADSPANPKPCDDGATYSVASFHTHTPTEFRAAENPPGTTRGVGPSGADNRIDTQDDVPGVVYDYVESSGGSGEIPMGHPKDSPAQLYHSRGRDRRSTPN